MIAQSEETNVLLGLIAPADYALLKRAGSRIVLEKGVDLARPRDSVSHGWFPGSGLISMIAMNARGGEAEVGVIGIDGFAGYGLILGGDRHAQRLLVQVSGSALVVPAAAVRALMISSHTFGGFMLAYIEGFFAQAASSALAFATLTIPERLARWLLMCADRVDTDNIDLTHDALGIMLGVRRAGVTVALHKLIALGAIEASRGRIAITNREVLLGAAGGNYGEAEREAAYLLQSANKLGSTHNSD